MLRFPAPLTKFMRRLRLECEKGTVVLSRIFKMFAAGIMPR